MQALIDYDGWRKWKDFAHTKEEAEVPKKSSKPKKTKNRLSITAPA
jgi:osomolarity two-component system response regulator SSK1